MAETRIFELIRQVERAGTFGGKAALLRDLDGKADFLKTHKVDEKTQQLLIKEAEKLVREVMV